MTENVLEGLKIVLDIASGHLKSISLRNPIHVFELKRLSDDLRWQSFYPPLKKKCRERFEVDF